MNQVVGPREHLTVLDAFSGKEHKEAVNQYYEEIFVRLPQNTQRAYKSDIKDYQNYCVKNGLQSFSTDAKLTEQSIKLYFLDLSASPNISHATVRRRKAAISAFLGMAKLPNPLNSKYLNDLITRELATANKYSRGEQATPLTDDLLIKINSILKPDNLLDARDLAVINVMYDGLLRSDEACKITLGDINRRDGTIYVPATKSDQTGKGSFRFISNTSIKIVDAYLLLAKITVSDDVNVKALLKTQLFRGLSPKKTSVLATPISYPTIYRIFQRLAKLAHLNVHLSSHSARVGAAVTMAENGVSDLDIQRAGGWKSTAMPSRYTEQARVSTGGMAQIAKLTNR